MVTLSLCVSLCALQKFPVSDLSGSTIQRQRRELQLLMAELKDRDRELNTMAASHHKRLHAWEQDRQRVLTLEQRCARLDGEDTETTRKSSLIWYRSSLLSFTSTITIKVNLLIFFSISINFIYDRLENSEHFPEPNSLFYLTNSQKLRHLIFAS